MHAERPRPACAVIGTPQPRLDGPDKVTGRARYSGDIRLPGQLHARVLRSPLAHARIARIDTRRAAALPGVRAVLSSEDAPDIDWYEGGKLFDRTVRFVGDEVAAVAAETDAIAEDALRLVEVDYEPLDAVVDIDAALRPGAPHVHEGGNVAGQPAIDERGSVAAGFREADVVIDQHYVTPTALHNPLEPHGCTVSWDAHGLTIHASTQGIFALRAEMAERLGLREDEVRVITQHMGGGFGAKQIAWKHDAIAALLSRRAGRPVQLMLDREAENLAVGNRGATRQHVRIGAKRDGRLTAIEARIEVQVGAYLVGGEASEVHGIYQTLYRCPNVRTEQRAVYTHTGPAVAFRAPGYVEGAFALESAMDELARALAMDPIALRLANYTEDDQRRRKPYTSPDSLRRCYDEVARAFGWRAYASAPAQGAKRRGVGFAAHVWVGGGGWPPADARVQLHADGSAEVVTGTQDIGTGTRTALAQIVAEELTLTVGQVCVSLGDTARGPYAPTSAGSGTLATLGPAVQAAARDARRRLLECAASLLKSDVPDLALHEGRVGSASRPHQAISIAEIARRAAPRVIEGKGSRAANPKRKSVRTFGAQCAEVEVDTDTGEVTVLRVVATHDCGRIVNPAIVESQVAGGITQGLGYALSEERVLDARTGVVLNADLQEYKVPGLADIPVIVHAALDLPDPEANSLGAKGIGEPPIVPTAPAIANAVFDAVGVRIREAPLTRRRMLEALGTQRPPGPAGEGR